MSDPKELTTLKELTTRLEAIKTADSFSTDLGENVTRGRSVTIPADDCPALFVYMGERANASADKPAYMCKPEVAIHGHLSVGDSEHPEDVALLAIADIHRAVELPYDPTRQQDQKIGKFEWISDDHIYQPEESGLVSVVVIYSFSTGRKYGEY